MSQLHQEQATFVSALTRQKEIAAIQSAVGNNFSVIQQNQAGAEAATQPDGISPTEVVMLSGNQLVPASTASEIKPAPEDMLIDACKTGNLMCVQLLVEHLGVDINALSKREGGGNTGLHWGTPASPSTNVHMRTVSQVFLIGFWVP